MQHQPIKVMGVLNITPDSFFDGGRYTRLSAAIEQAEKMVQAGASIIDIGGESTRPDALQISVDEELDRVIPLIETLRSLDVLISIDTSKAQVMSEAVKAGARMINDVYALRQPGALATAAKLGVPVCLMHMQGEPRSMQASPQYTDVIDEVSNFLRERVDSCIKAGIARDNIYLDPGFGFGKSLEHNLSLLKYLNKIVELDYPVLVGLSRKSMLAAILNVDVTERLIGSLALATVAVMNGASIVRVHDVGETMQVVKICESVMQAE